jgi:hypothetical protein
MTPADSQRNTLVKRGTDAEVYFSINQFAVFTTISWATVLSSTPNSRAQNSKVKSIGAFHACNVRWDERPPTR